MDTGWIQVFVLVLTECVAPAGKTVCQEQELRYEFFDKADCDSVLEQLLTHKGGEENVIVNKEKSACLPTAKKREVFRTLNEAELALADTEGWGRIPASEDAQDFTQKAHQERLASMPSCGDNGGIAPCKIGDIIIEGATEKRTEVWRSAD
jgi:hypothetical protein